MNIADGLRSTARAYPNKIGVIDRCAKYVPDKTTYTWGQFNERANRLANGLISLGLKKGDRVGIYSESRSPFATAYHALMKAGVVLVPLNIAYKGDELIFLANDSEPKAMFIDADRMAEVTKIRSQVPSLKFTIGFGSDHGCDYDFETLIKNNGPEDPNVPVAEEDVASLLYTSGTTGRPKGAMMTHRNWCFAAIILTAEWRILPRHRFLHVLSPFFSGGMGFMTIGAFRGVTLVLCDWNTEKVMKVLQEEKINYSMMAPAMTSMIVNHPDVKKYDFSAMERIITSAAPISPGLLKKATEVFGDVYTFTYGTSETALGGCQIQFEDVDLNGPTAKRIAAVGKSMMGMNVRVLDDNGKEVPWGSELTGEVVVSGPTVGNAYWKKPEAEDLKDGTWYSGDVARVDEDGYIYIVDRKKDMILSGGANIYPREIEDVLYAHPAVQQAAVIGIPNELWGESVKAIIVLKPGSKVTEQEMLDYCKENMADYKKPRLIEFREKLPMNPSGKILKRELRDEHWKGRESKI